MGFDCGTVQPPHLGMRGSHKRNQTSLPRFSLLHVSLARDRSRDENMQQFKLLRLLCALQDAWRRSVATSMRGERYGFRKQEGPTIGQGHSAAAMGMAESP